MELAVGSNNTQIDKHHLVMEKDQRVRYKFCTTDYEVDNTLPDSQNSSIQSRSPRCEAFVMTGDKMLNLNPKISPSYAKMCHDQLPPAVHVEPEKKLKNENHFDHFPSMHKNNHGRIRSAIMLGTSEENSQIDFSTKPESQSEKDEEKVSEILKEVQDNTSNNKNFESESSCINVIPADPSNIPQFQNSENNFLGNDFSINLPQQQNNLTFNAPLISSSTISRLISSNQSQSMPASPARVFTNKQTNLIEQALIAATEKGQNINLDDEIPNQVCSSSLSMQSSAGTMPLLYSSYPPETISRLARHLFTHQEGIKIAAFLVKTDDLSMKIAREFVNLFNFAGLRIDAALQAFSSRVQLCDESGDKAQLLAHFAHRYFECNPVIFKNVEEVHALSCALISLNNSLQGNANNVNIRDFINDLTNSGFKFDAAMLKDLFITIRNQPFNKQENQLSQFNTNSTFKEKRLSKIIFNKKSESSIKTSSFVNPVEQQVDYKRGWLMKKSLYDVDGKRTPIGRRKWQMLYATIRGMVIYLHQDENSFSCRNRYLTYKNCILIHHSLAEVPKDYTKKKNVFRLKTANFGEFLFQTSDSTEVEKWIDAINYVAAAFSAPVLPTPVGANKAFIFCKPKYSSTPTHLSLVDQLHAHEQRLEETKESLTNLQQCAPPIKSKGKLVYDYFYKERFLDSEKERYICYINVLREKLNAGTKVINNCDTNSQTFNAKKENSTTTFVF
uniref:Uncharacterized protein n=1 Tax=Meloidogyne enterolobii TaxID=390850 RepID=A0A6V7Y8U1_MELEN|nr:unnamed protein product [Meloidogyne enterolobii]